MIDAGGYGRVRITIAPGLSVGDEPFPAANPIQKIFALTYFINKSIYMMGVCMLNTKTYLDGAVQIIFHGKLFIS